MRQWKRISSVLGLVGVLVCMGSCTHNDINGDLDGVWQLRHIENTETGTVETVQDSLRFMAVQLHLMELRGPKIGRQFARFQHVGDSLFIQVIDSATVERSWMMLFGMDGPQQRFKVELLNGEKMVLRGGGRRLGFRKF
jgi:hypothetical protein